MKVEIIICTYNRAKKLRDAIQSILDADTYDGVGIELIVVNNNSTDDTEAIIKYLAKKVSKIKIHYFFEEKKGKSYALNTALKHVAGDLIAFTDDDVTVDKGWIREMINASKKYPGYNCFGGKVVALYPENIPKWLDIKGSMKFLKSVFVDRDDGDIEVEYGVNTFSDTPGGVNMFFRKDAIKKNGFFRTDLGPIGGRLGFSEDTEYCQRLVAKREKFMYVPSSIVYHPVHMDRLNDKYLLKWQYKCGISEVRRNEGYKDTAKVFGVPRYLFRKFIQHSAGWWLSFQIKKRFYHKLRLYYTTGEIVEHLKIGFKSL